MPFLSLRNQLWLLPALFVSLYECLLLILEPSTVKSVSRKRPFALSVSFPITLPTFWSTHAKASEAIDASSGAGEW